MNRDSDTENEIIDFLMSYPEAIPSMQDKSRIVARVQRGIVKSQANRMSTMDILFALLLSTILVLSFCNALLPELSAGQILGQFYQLQFLHRILLYIALAGLLTTPLLLTILPSNKGGNR